MIITSVIKRTIMKLIRLFSKIIIFFITVILFGSFLGGCNNDSHLSADNSNTTLNSSRVKYTSNDGRFEFLVPEDWLIDDNNWGEGIASIISLYKPQMADVFPANRLASLDLIILDNNSLRPLVEIEGFKSYLLSPKSGYTNLNVNGRNVIFVPLVPGMFLSNVYLFPFDEYILEIDQYYDDALISDAVVKDIISSIRAVK